MSTASAFPMYPRGFLGGYPPASIQRERQPAINRPLFDHQYRLNIVRPADNSTCSNSTITSLYNEYIARTLKSETFEFKKQVLRAALAAFGTDRFDRWYVQQLYSPAFGDNHSRFLDDTLNFISGKPREMSTTMWGTLLEMEANTSVPAKASAIAERFFGLSNMTGVDNGGDLSGNAKLDDAIQSWMSKPGGFEDLLMTLNILFGAY